MQLRSRRPWLRAPRANPAAEPRVDRVHTAPADRAPPHRGPAHRADLAHRAPVDRADRVDPAHTAPADRAGRANSADQVVQADPAHTAPGDPADPVNSDQADPVDTVPAGRASSADRADRAATAHGMEIHNVATSREPPGGTDKGPGGRVSHQGRPTTEPFRRPGGDGTTVQSTTSAINKRPGGILDSTNGASTSSVFGSRCKDQLTRRPFDQPAKRAPRLLDCCATTSSGQTEHGPKRKRA